MPPGPGAPSHSATLRFVPTTSRAKAAPKAIACSSSLDKKPVVFQTNTVCRNLPTIFFRQRDARGGSRDSTALARDAGHSLKMAQRARRLRVDCPGLSGHLNARSGAVSPASLLRSRGIALEPAPLSSPPFYSPPPPSKFLSVH